MACDIPNMSIVLTAISHENPGLEPSGMLVPLDLKTTITLYLNYLKQYPGKINLVYSAISELQKFVKDTPNEVADCIEILIDKQENNYIPKEIEEIIKSILEVDKETKPKCQKIIEKLATLGTDWRYLLND